MKTQWLSQFLIFRIADLLLLTAFILAWMLQPVMKWYSKRQKKSV